MSGSIPPAGAPPRILGAVLAGGRSRRFGSDKALAVVAGRRLIDRALDALEPHVATVIVCGRSALDDRVCIPDLPGPDLGPLGGLNAALHYAQVHGFARVLTLPCDVIALQSDDLARLIAAGPASFVADMPVIGLWPAALAGALAEHLATSPDRSVRGWGAAVDARPIRIAGLANINTRDDLDRMTARRS